MSKSAVLAENKEHTLEKTIYRLDVCKRACSIIFVVFSVILSWVLIHSAYQRSLTISMSLLVYGFLLLLSLWGGYYMLNVFRELMEMKQRKFSILNEIEQGIQGRKRFKRVGL